MNLKTLLSFILLALLTEVFAVEPATTKIKLYGYVGNDFFYNSRQNQEMVDGIIQLFPKPISLKNGVDENAVPQAEMLSINSRLGIDIAGTPILNATSSGKIEADFAGFGTTFYVFRIRQAYMKLNWANTELLVGQTWHPLFGSILPTTFSANAGSPFQPFNRSPQVRLKQNMNSTLSLSAAVIYEMQYASQGPIGTSNTYMKNSLMPDLYVGVENKTSHWTNGIGVDFKRIKPAANYISSLSAVAYSQYVNEGLQVKAKAVYGENLSDQLMLGGYAVSKYNSDSTKVLSYSNFQNLSGWLNIIYGSKIQVGLLLGASTNLGTNEKLALNKTNQIIGYGYGLYDQNLLDKLYRIAPHVSYNLSNIKFGLEYDFTTATYGTINTNGRISNPSTVNNNRVLASVNYIF